MFRELCILGTSIKYVHEILWKKVSNPVKTINYNEQISSHNIHNRSLRVANSSSLLFEDCFLYIP